MNVSHLIHPILFPSRPQINQWFLDAMTYDGLKVRVIDGQLGLLSADERALILQFIVRKGWLHYAVKSEDKQFVTMLAKAGIDLNTSDENGSSPFAYALTPEMFIFMYEKGAQFHDNDKTILQFLLDRCSGLWRQDNWRKLLGTIITELTLKNFCGLEAEQLICLMKLAKRNAAIKNALLPMLKGMAAENPNEALSIARKLFMRYDSHKYKMRSLWLIENKAVQDPLIEQIVADPEIASSSIGDDKFYAALKKCWQPTGHLKELIDGCGNFTFGIYIRAILNSTTLNGAAQLLSNLTDFSDSGVQVHRLDKGVKEELREHISALEEKERNTIWLEMAECHCTIDALFHMKRLGFDPQMTDPVYGQTLLFTKLAGLLRSEADCRELELDLSHIDLKRNNALEHHCKNINTYSLISIQTLVMLKVRLSDRFPDVVKCRSVFSDNDYFQTVLAACLCHPAKIRKEFLRSFEAETRANDYGPFKNAVLSDIMLRDVIYSFQQPDKQHWKDKFKADDREMLDKHVEEKLGKPFDLNFLTSFWENEVPSETLTVIPESPLASLIVEAMRKQHQQLTERRIKKPASIGRLLCPSLGHDDMVHLNRYLFAHPEIMHMLVQDYMKAKVVSIRPGEGSVTVYGKVTLLLMKRMGKLKHLSSHLQKLPGWHQKLLGAFDTPEPPVAVQTLQIPDDSKVRLLGRTVVVTSKTGTCDAFKFLKPGEKYDYFSQEHSVCKALKAIKSQFESRIIEPVGMYAVEKLPSVFSSFEHSLGGLHRHFVFHYKTCPETYVYLQDVPAEKYAQSRKATLHDAAKLIRLGIYPDLAAMFHNHQASRRYVLLVDLMARLMRNQSDYSDFDPAGGAGRLEIPFAKTKYPNARQTGMTDWRDAVLYYGREDFVKNHIKDMEHLCDKEDGTVKYFYQMNALSSVLLIDMLILAERYINNETLNWQDQVFVRQFGMELAEGFALLSAAYSNKSYDQMLTFTLECGVDWALAAKQIAFWLDRTSQGYPGWIAQGRLPPGLYEEGIYVEVDVARAKNFDKLHGFRTDGNQDIGCYNGPLALDQFEKAAHLIFNAVALAEPLISLPEPVRYHRPGVSDFKESDEE